MGRDSSVGAATRYGLDGPGMVFHGGGEIFRTRPDWPWGRGINHSSPSSAEVKERVKLYLLSRSWPILE